MCQIDFDIKMNSAFNLNLSFAGTGAFFKEGYIGKQYNYHHQGKTYDYSCIEIPQIYHFSSLYFPAFFLNQKATIKQSVPNTPSIVNINKSKIDLKGVKLGIINIAPYQPAAKLTNSSESIERSTGSNLLIQHNISEEKYNYNK